MSSTRQYFPIRDYFSAPSQRLGDTDDEKPRESPFPRYLDLIPPAWKAVLVGVVVVAMIGIGVFATKTMSVASSKTAHTNPCGNSTAEALALGCSFDRLTWSWYPAHCPHYTEDLFRLAEPYKYYETLESIQPISDPARDEDLFKFIDKQGGVWVEKREHATHCLYLLLAQAQVLKYKTRHVPILVEYFHMEHCVNYLLDILRRSDDWHHKDSFTPPVHHDQTC
ncbi:hypothetical protein X797_011840 [Metarhizium robertsii]|uniref:Uncharacterized protein n=2 Tax=Metarhizium robertsii TaxID=568076 RepID=E9FCM6_METRA|nr:uncharacterized protein MAA_10025 [Metarhizium robertsii ARSEF 23]EFY94533.1 hypothetical protein MAA_10025 [Metarhizium robertsii ARSEF 23]EXU95081.1 hypothetical protein X797_011840 [Metarhizium robertsii]